MPDEVKPAPAAPGAPQPPAAPPVAAAEEPAAPPPPPPLPEWVQAVTAAVPDGIEAVLGLPGGDGDADVPSICIKRERWFEAVAAVKAQGFDFFADLAGVDHPDRPARFDVVLHLRDLDAGRLVRCRTQVGEGDPLASVEPLFAGAGWPEREVFDLLGVRFTGNVDMRRLLLPDDWAGHPLRRDYPLTGPRELDPDGKYAM